MAPIKKLYSKLGLRSKATPPPPPKPDSAESEEDEEESNEYRKFLAKLYPKKEKSESDSEEDDDDEYTDCSSENDESVGGKRQTAVYMIVSGEDNADDDGSDEQESEDEDEDVDVSSSEDEGEVDKERRKRERQEAAESRILLDQLKTLPPSTMVDQHMKLCEEKIAKATVMDAKKAAKQSDKNGRIFKRLVREQDRGSESRYYRGLDVGKQKQLIKEMREIRRAMGTEKPYRVQLLESTIPVALKAEAMRKIDSLDGSEPGYGEYFKLKSWIDTFMQIPFGVTHNMPVSVNDGVEACHAFMESAQKTLDEAVYGLDDTKSQVMQLVGQLITNPAAVGCSIALNGPPGTGKTTLLKDGVSRILKRPFAFIALGGATDSSFLEGHSYTYEGSVCGRIVQIMIESKCMNPLIFMDELDKISDTPKGEEITNILLHLTDSTQNMQFHEKYFSGVSFDLSRCIFVFSYNDESRINPVLLDRMYKIRTKGYSGAEKQIIATQHLLPKIRELVRFGDGDVILPKETIGFIVDNYCGGEEGARNLKRCLEIIHTKLNLYRLMKLGTALSDKHKLNLSVSFPFTVTRDVVSKLLPQPTEKSAMNMMYV
jgi:ATP-dependent Lon protease